MEKYTDLEYFEAELEDKGYDKEGTEVHDKEGFYRETDFTRDDIFVTIESVSDQDVTAVEFQPCIETDRDVATEDFDEGEIESAYEYLDREYVEFNNNLRNEPFMLRLGTFGSIEKKFDDFKEAEDTVETLQNVRSWLGA